jgi:hypothetical protein
VRESKHKTGRSIRYIMGRILRRTRESVMQGPKDTCRLQQQKEKALLQN